MHSKFCPCAAIGAMFFASVAAAGPDWDFDLTVDAGPSQFSAQPIVLSGPVNTIVGRLAGNAFVGEGDFQDCYQIVISDPGTFMINLASPGSSFLNFDACLWLFDANGAPLLGTNDQSPDNNAPMMGNSSNAGPMVTITTPGIYYLAISGFASQPTFFGVTCFPQFVFNPGIVAGGVTIGWDGWSGPGATGDYVMTVTGVSGVPAPGAAALLALMPFSGRRRRR